MARFYRLAASTMQSAFFTAAIARDMLFIERIEVLLYLTLWIAAALMGRSAPCGRGGLAALPKLSGIGR